MPMLRSKNTDSVTQSFFGVLIQRYLLSFSVCIASWKSLFCLNVHRNRKYAIFFKRFVIGRTSDLIAQLMVCTHGLLEVLETSPDGGHLLPFLLRHLMT